MFKETNNRMLSGYLLRDVMNQVDEINFASSDDTHTMTHFYESMLKDIRDAAGDSGTFAKLAIESSVTSTTSLNRIRGGQFIYSQLFAFEGAYADVSNKFDGYFVSNEFPTFDVDPGRSDARWLTSYLRLPPRWCLTLRHVVALPRTGRQHQVDDDRNRVQVLERGAEP